MAALFVIVSTTSPLLGDDIRDASIPRSPNIVLLLADDLGWADVGFHNPQMRTPRLDQLANLGVELDCHYVMPMCTPTRVALMTGRYPSRFGNHCTQASNEQALPFGTATLASVLHDAGYDTALIGKWHLGSRPEWGPNHYGFDYSYGSLSGMAPYDHRYRLTRPEYTRTFHRNHEFIDEPGHTTDLTAREAIEWIRRDRESPFFLYVPFHAVHVPLVEEPQWLEANEHIESVHARLFAAAVTHMDDAIGQIVAAIEDEGLTQNTLILFLSDNGGLLEHRGGKYPPPDPPMPKLGSNAPWRGRKRELYEGGIRVPAIAAWPGHLKPCKITTPMHAVDWLPTLARLAGAVDSVPPEVDGRDVWGTMAGCQENQPARVFYWVVQEDRRWKAVRYAKWKIVRFGDEPWQLFDLVKDPQETNDLALQKPDVLQELLELYESEKVKDKLAADAPG